MLCVATFSLPELRPAAVRRRRQQQWGGTDNRWGNGVRGWGVGWSCMLASTSPSTASNRSMRTRAMQATSTATTTSPSHPSPTASNLPNSTTYRCRHEQFAIVFIPESISVVRLAAVHRQPLGHRRPRLRPRLALHVRKSSCQNRGGVVR